ILGIYAASTTTPNRTTQALGEACPGQALPVEAEVPFSSAYKWSALSFDSDALGGTYVLGASETLRGHLQVTADLERQVSEWTSRGLRVLLFAHRPQVAPLHDSGDSPQLPVDLSPLALLSFADELRPEARETIAKFAEMGVELKIISGDSPDTVEALARQAGLTGELGAVSGLELAEADEYRFAHLAREGTIFGRISPQQKERLVQTLRTQGQYVAMVGDGVNDVLSLKQANLGIAMQSGSMATRSVADIILLEDSFGALPEAFLEGQRIRNGMQDILKLLLTRVGYTALLIASAAFLGVGFPFVPAHLSVVSFLTGGVPAFVLALWAPPGIVPRRRLIRSLLHFILPATFTLVLFGLAIYLVYFLRGLDLPLLKAGDATISQGAFDAATRSARNALTLATVLGWMLLIPFVRPPTSFWVGGAKLSGDWRPTMVAAVMLVTYAGIASVPLLRDFFDLTPLGIADYLTIGAVMGLWALTVRYVWRHRLFDRFLDAELGG
ncbi:MAG: HAD-IC family P-type ATPase, partial [Chloroflexota bacterium]|nr:HAD-IC family P-type ATPase [Chloroflexota bacterium]